MKLTLKVGFLVLLAALATGCTNKMLYRVQTMVIDPASAQLIPIPADLEISFLSSNSQIKGSTTTTMPFDFEAPASAKSVPIISVTNIDQEALKQAGNKGTIYVQIATMQSQGVTNQKMNKPIIFETQVTR